MALENFSEWTAQFSIDRILGGDFSAFISIFYLVIAIAIYSILILHFYRFIATRDCFKITRYKDFALGIILCNLYLF